MLVVVQFIHNPYVAPFGPTLIAYTKTADTIVIITDMDQGCKVGACRMGNVIVNFHFITPIWFV